MSEQIRICIEDDKGVVHKVTSIYLLSDGSFKLDVPYCPYDEGFVFKFPVNYGRQSYNQVELFPKKFKAKNRPQLSIHASGFVQFSGQGVTSGIDEQGEPKGLGVYSNPLDTPILSGPTLGATIWGLDKYEEAKKLSPNDIVFKPSDHLRRILRDFPLNHKRNTNLNTHLIEIFVFHESLASRIRQTDRGEMMTLNFPQYYECPNAIFTFPVIRLLNHGSFLGILPFIGNTEFPEKTDFGFNFGSPSGLETIDGKTDYYAISLMYPNIMPETEGYLDYKKKDEK